MARSFLGGESAWWRGDWIPERHIGSFGAYVIGLHLLQISANCSDTYHSLLALLLTRTACKSTTLFFVICLGFFFFW